MSSSKQYENFQDQNMDDDEECEICRKVGLETTTPEKTVTSCSSSSDEEESDVYDDEDSQSETSSSSGDTGYDVTGTGEKRSTSNASDTKVSSSKDLSFKKKVEKRKMPNANCPVCDSHSCIINSAWYNYDFDPLFDWTFDRMSYNVWKDGCSKCVQPDCERNILSEKARKRHPDLFENPKNYM